MINGIAMLSCPESAVTINVAREATARDHQRLRGAAKQFSRRSFIIVRRLYRENAVKLKYGSGELPFFELES
jgi:hypothetical protein